MPQKKPTASAARQAPAGPARAYLVLYNAVSLGLWAYVLATLVATLRAGGWAHAAVGQTMGPLVAGVQSVAVLEILHSALGLVRSPLFTTVLQVASRLFLAVVVVGVYAHPPALASAGFVCMVGAWAVTEVVRYAFYLLALLGIDLAPVTWLRYSTFLVLYPLGVGGELAMIYQTLPALEKPAGAPGADYAWILMGFFYAAMATYLPGFPVMFGHMLKQRRRLYGGAKGGHKRE